MEQQLRRQIRAALLAAPDEQARARTIYDIVRAAYDTVKSVHAGGGQYDIAERRGIARVSDADHWKSREVVRAARCRGCMCSASTLIAPPRTVP